MPAAPHRTDSSQRRSLAACIGCVLRRGAAFNWAAGQHLVVVRGQGKSFSYRIRSPPPTIPQNAGEFELAVAIRAGADVIDTLPWARSSRSRGPPANFIWQAAPSPAALLVGVGTGIAPLRALIEEELARASETRLLLLAGHRAPEDVLFAEDFARLAAEHARFRFMPTLTGAAPSGSVDGAGFRRNCWRP